jgi:hypothetical protein
MEDVVNIESHVRQTMLSVLSILYKNGVTIVSVGGLLRIFGVPNAVATNHDNEYIEIDEELSINDLDQLSILEPCAPEGTTIH